MSKDKQTTIDIKATDATRRIAAQEYKPSAELIADIERAAQVIRQYDPEPMPGFRFCANVTCGVEVRIQHPTRACRAHRSDGKTRERPEPLATVTHPLTYFAAIDQEARDSISEAIRRGVQ